jgi:hypothetical protein
MSSLVKREFALLERLMVSLIHLSFINSNFLAPICNSIKGEKNHAIVYRSSLDLDLEESQRAQVPSIVADNESLDQ